MDSISLAHKHYIIRFFDSLAKDLVLGRPWVVNGQPIAVIEWYPELIPTEDSILCALLWIRLPLLPIEFWSDVILSSILSVAGQYLFSDESTKERKRDGFARACVPIDLGKSLQPGARVHGNREPFWQQFSYENLEGICASCGSLHLAEACGSVPEPSSSLFGPRFGPWMAATQRRKPPPDQPSVSRKLSAAGREAPCSSPAAPRPSSISSDGWQAPKKIARRQLRRGAIVPVEVSPSRFEGVPIKPPACRADLGMSVGTVAGPPKIGTEHLESDSKLAEGSRSMELNPFCLSEY